MTRAINEKFYIYMENWQDLIAAIYQQAIEDIALKPDKHPDYVTAKTFIKKNPFGLEVNFDQLIKFTEKKYNTDKRRFKK